MGNALSEPYERTEYQSGASRLLNSIFMAICVAPLLIIGMCVMLGWNEQQAVCSQKAISAGRDNAKLVGCDNPMAGTGSLVLFSCDIDTASLPELQFSRAGAFASFKQKATGIKIMSEMYQCVEDEQKHDQKSKTGGGGKTTTYTYSYRLDWKSTVIDSGSFGSPRSRQAENAFNNGPCQGNHNPTSWPANAPQTETIYAPAMKVGAFTTGMTNKVPIETPVNIPAPSGWKTNTTGSFRTYTSSPRIGDVRVAVKSNDPHSVKATVLGQNFGGSIGQWKAPASWLCSGNFLSDLRMGTVGIDALFDKLSSEANTTTWILRFVGFAIMWCAFSLCFGPLEVAGDCIPCVGPWIGDSIAAITCCISCLPATACTLGVAGLVWMVMRPLIGIPMMLAFVIIIGGYGFYIAKQRAAKNGGQIAGSAPNPNYGAVQYQPPMPQAVAVAQPVAPQPPRQMQVQAPLGSFPGQMVQFQTPDGAMMSTQVPQGIQPGGFFTASY